MNIRRILLLVALSAAIALPAFAQTPGTTTVNLSSSDPVVRDYAGTAISAPGDVTTTDDLNAYAATTLHSDSNIAQARLSGGGVSLTYKQPARLLGIMNIAMDTTAKVASDGSVSIMYPWYHFLANASDTDLTANIQNNVESTLSNTSAVADAAGNYTPQTQAELMADITAGFVDTITAASST